jgi:hypothetical protein
MAPKSRRPIRGTATPRHATSRSSKPSMMALEPRPPTPSIDRAAGLSAPGRPRGSAPPFPRRTQERACSSAPAPPAGGPMDRSFHACIPHTHPATHDDPPVSSRPLASRGFAVAARGLRGRPGRRTAFALHCMSCGDNQARVPPRGPCPRVAVTGTVVSSQIPMGKTERRAGNERGVVSPAKAKQTNKVAALFHFHSFPLGFGNPFVPLISFPRFVSSLICALSLYSLWTPLRDLANVSVSDVDHERNTVLVLVVSRFKK